MDNLFSNKYGNDYWKQNHIKNSYPFLFINKGISALDIKRFIATLIFMGIHKLPQIDNYWNNSIIFSNNIPSVIIKN